MSNTYFQFKQFRVNQDRCAMKVTTDACLFGGSLPPAPSNGGGGNNPVHSGVSLKSNVLDLGTGTGLLSLMYAQKNPGAIIDAVEIDQEAAEQAAENIKASPWENRITVIHADARQIHFTKKYDLIISNPPFYEKELKSPNPLKNIALHGEELALRDLFLLIKLNLAPGGLFCVLLPYKRLAECKTLLRENDLAVTHTTLLRQSVYHEVFRFIITGSKREAALAEKNITSEILIWNDRQEYTPEFSALLKDFYLNG